MSPVPTYTLGCRKTKWSKVSCLRKQRHGARLEPLTSGSWEFEVLVTRPQTPPQAYDRNNCYAEQFFAHIWLIGSLISHWVQLADKLQAASVSCSVVWIRLCRLKHAWQIFYVNIRKKLIPTKFPSDFVIRLLKGTTEVVSTHTKSSTTPEFPVGTPEFLQHGLCLSILAFFKLLRH